MGLGVDTTTSPPPLGNKQGCFPTQPKIVVVVYWRTYGGGSILSRTTHAEENGDHSTLTKNNKVQDNRERSSRENTRKESIRERFVEAISALQRRKERITQEEKVHSYVSPPKGKDQSKYSIKHWEMVRMSVM